MAALTLSVEIPLLGGGVKVRLPDANAALTVWGGSFLYGLAAGFVTNTGMGGGDRIIGITPFKQVTTAQGDPLERVIGGTYLWPAIASITTADIGDALVMKVATLTNNPLDCTALGDAAAANNDIYVGRIIGIDAAGRAVVCCDGMGLLNTVTTGAAVL